MERDDRKIVVCCLSRKRDVLIFWCGGLCGGKENNKRMIEI
jgi:hypothetical protein